MGTSSSFRSPHNPRWNVFNRALDSQLSLERVRVTLFLAGEAEWKDALQAPGLANFPVALLKAHGGLDERLAAAEQPASVIAEVVNEARSALFEEAYSPALPVAERALRAVLVQAVQSPVPLADANGQQASEAWRQNRGDPPELVRRYISELFGQWSAHVLARDTARLCGPDTDHTASEIRAFTRAVSKQVADLAESVTQPPTKDIAGYWQDAISAVFDRGRQLEKPQ